MYNHESQYRCTIIRGKSQKEMDDLLPAYAKVIDEICPCAHEDFERRFNNELQSYLPESARIKKTLDNHRTEISGKLFGMYYFSSDGMVYESERTQKFLEDNDQPAFFKDICYKMQFPNGMQKANTILERLDNDISIRPNAFVLKFLQVAEAANVDVTKKDIGYYILNSLDVLQGRANPYEVLEAVVDDKGKGIERIIAVEGKASSYNYQHITEQLNYLELANLIRYTDDRRVVLNKKEEETIDLFSEKWNEPPAFNVYYYDLLSTEDRKEFKYAWDYYYSQLSEYADRFETTAESLVSDESEPKVETKKKSINLVEFGDEGEAVVFEYEKNRVFEYNPSLVNKVLSLGKTKGLGYDIQSVIAEPGDIDEFVKYIEVKSTKRLTPPDTDDTLWIDTLNITRNEWVAANQHKEFYSIYRVYFTREGIVMYVLNNVAQQLQDRRMTAVPVTYRLTFGSASVSEEIVIKDYGEEN